MIFKETVDRLLAGQTEPTVEELAAIETMLARMYERQPEPIEVWAHHVAQWIVDIDFGEYE